MRNWAKEEINATWSKENTDKIAMTYIDELVKLNIINKKMVDIEFKQNGQVLVNRAATLTKAFVTKRDKLIRDMWHKAPMKCKPMQNKPRNWNNMWDGIGPDANICLIKNARSEAKVSPNVLSAVNKLQGVRFTVPECIIETAYEYICNEAHYAPKKEGKTDAEYASKMAQYKDHIRMCEELMELEEFSFYFPVTMDQRGRMYYRGGLVSPQGTDLCKAAFQFKDSMPLGENGLEAILIHTANVLGEDKLSYNERYNYALSQYNTLLTMETHLDIKKTYPRADHYQALVAAKELQKLDAWLSEDKSEKDFPSTLVCHQDGTCNGLQHMAALTKNRQTAITVNCTGSTKNDTPHDIYGIIAVAASELASGKAKDLIQQFGRAMAKKPVMVTGYGAGVATVCRGVAEFLTSKGEKVTHAQAIGEAYCKAIDKHAEAVRTFTNSVVRMLTKAYKSGETIGGVTWTTADGFVAHTEYMDIETARIRGKNYNATCMELGKPVEDDVKTVYAMAPNFVHSIDATHLRMVINACNHDLVTVHDSIGSHAGSYHKTAKEIRKQFVEVHEYNAMENLCQNIQQRTPRFIGDYDAKEALQSTYIFS
jgi:DNA-directed RNA polymerase